MEHATTTTQAERKELFMFLVNEVKKLANRTTVVTDLRGIHRERPHYEPLG